MKKVFDKDILGKSCQVFELTGVVIDEKLRSDTVVHGTSYRGGDTGTIPSQISSYTVNRHNLFLKDDAGNEHVIRWQGEIHCREGHRLTFRGFGGDEWFEYINHDTGENVWSKSTIEDNIKPNIGSFKHAIVVFLIVYGAMLVFNEVTAILVLFGFVGAVVVAGAIVAFIMNPIGLLITKARDRQFATDYANSLNRGR